jgi:hypothetical protein
MLAHSCHSQAHSCPFLSTATRCTKDAQRGPGLGGGIVSSDRNPKSEFTRMASETEEFKSITNALAEIHTLLEQGQNLAAIDLALQYLNLSTDEKTNRRFLRLLCRAALVHCNATVTDNEPAIDAAFHPELSSPIRRFLAICFLRAMETNPNLFNDVALRNRTFLLFDGEIPDLYKDSKIDVRRQTHEKEAALRSYVHDAEHELEEILRPLERMKETAWESVAHSRTDILRLLRKYGSILNPFLSKDLLGRGMEEQFQQVRDYLESDEWSALHTYERARTGLLAYWQQGKEFRTKYSSMLCERLAQILFTICERKFEQSGAGKPAKLIARPSDKKYPLYSVGRLVNLGFSLENIGPGYARDVSCSLSSDGSAIVKRGELFLGNLGVDKIAVEFPVEISEAVNSVVVDLSWTWLNFDGSSGHESGMFELFGQQADIDWEQLTIEEPYKLEPITLEQELVGRTEILSQLAAKARGARIGSACIWGQKRVGKTSIAKTLKTRLSSEPDKNLIILFVEAGEYIHSDANRTIEQLGTKICKQIALSDARFKNVPKPIFDGALSPLSDYCDEVLAISSDLRIVILLDEFDSVPSELYRRGSTGETFFATIRSLSQKGPIGFILIGGERMRYAFDCQGQALNKFQMIRVDYLDRSRHWTDYQDLITRPTKNWLQFSDSAFVKIYSESAGNPYYTVLICRSLFALMVARRDSYVTEREAEDAVTAALGDASTVNFQHFWDDAIIETGIQAEEISMRRRYVLLSLAEGMGHKSGASRDEVVKSARRYGLDARAVENELNEFIQREVLMERDGELSCKVPFLGRWLRTVGPRQISTTYTEAEALRISREEEDKATIRAEEVVRLIGRWGAYKGRSVTTDEVRAWLEQFGRKSDQRLMFKILQSIRFYTEDEVRNGVKVAHGIVVRGLVERVSHKQVKRWQSLIVSYLDGAGKSGARFASLFITENEMYRESLVERGQLKSTLVKRDDIQGLVFVDDFVGTGHSATEYLQSFIHECGDVIKEKSIKVFFLAVSGFVGGMRYLEEHIKSNLVSINVHFCELLDESDACFHDQSKTFTEQKERQRAKEIAFSKGATICKPAPLGYSGSEALVVFSHNCPNNTLPILWEKSREWTPLFRRD